MERLPAWVFHDEGIGWGDIMQPAETNDQSHNNWPSMESDFARQKSPIQFDALLPPLANKNMAKSPDNPSASSTPALASIPNSPSSDVTREEDDKMTESTQDQRPSAPRCKAGVQGIWWLPICHLFLTERPRRSWLCQ